MGSTCVRLAKCALSSAVSLVGEGEVGESLFLYAVVVVAQGVAAEFGVIGLAVLDSAYIV